MNPKPFPINTDPSHADASPGQVHTPVLLDACLNALRIRPDGVYVDGTLGRAGHACEIVRRLTSGRLIGIDRDGAALTASAERLVPWRERVTLIRGSFADLDSLLRQAGVREPETVSDNFPQRQTLSGSVSERVSGGVDGMLFDLGVSSPQLDDPARGFSYLRDAPLDMRMDTEAALSAFDVVNTWSEDELRRILYEYGEERYAPVIARAIARHREERPIRTTGELVEIIRRAMPARALRENQHPAKRTFQAVRIAVNGELDALEPMLRTAVRWLRPGGRFAVISFHSLEDRIVKQTLRELSQGCICPPSFPVCVCGRKALIRPVNRKPIVPDAAEIERNPRSRSAKLRVAEKL